MKPPYHGLEASFRVDPLIYSHLKSPSPSRGRQRPFFDMLEFISFRGWEFIFQRHKGRYLGDISNHEAHEEHEGGSGF